MRRFLRAAHGGFSLAIAVYATVGARDEAIGALLEDFPGIVCARPGLEDRDVLSSVRAACGAKQPPAVFVLDLERAVPFDGKDQPALRALNASRDLWPALGCPVVIWLPEYAVGLLARAAPDFWRYRSHTFEFAGERLAQADPGAPGFPGHAHIDGLSYEAKKARVAELEARLAGLPDPVPGSLRPHVAAWQTELAYLYQLIGDYTRAEALYRRLLATDEASYGPDHPAVATDISNLAQVLKATNRPAEAEPLMRRALQIVEASPGPDHPNVAAVLNNIAQLLQDTNRLAEAEALMRRALQIGEASYGPDHPEVASYLNNLAQLLQATNRLAEAEPLIRRALKIDEDSFGRDHPSVAIRLNNLAQLLQATNRVAEAEPLLRRALQIHEASYGPDHPIVATDLNNLAMLLKATNRLADAEPLMQRSLEILVAFKRATGHEHPRLRAALATYRALLLAMGRTHEEVERALRAIAPELLDDK